MNGDTLRPAERPAGDSPRSGAVPPAPEAPRTFAISEEAEHEIRVFESETARFLAGELAPERYRAFRLSHGIYGQRQPGVQMIRAKIPGGLLNGRQIRRLASIAEGYGHGIAHVTTRQDVQFHYVSLQKVPTVMRELAEVGLSTREACGNSVRNVTACPLTGHLAEEPFDVGPYAQALWAYLVRNPFCQQLARKFKIAVSSCPEDCAATGIHDIGAVGVVVEQGGRSRYGFRIVAGGGLGSTPFAAVTLEEFVPLERLLHVVRAILEVFSQHGNRRNKTRARLKFVVHKLGAEHFRQLVAEAEAALTPEQRQEAELLHWVPEPSRALVTEHLAGRPSLVEIRTVQALAAVRPAVWAALAGVAGSAASKATSGVAGVASRSANGKANGDANGKPNGDTNGKPNGILNGNGAKRTANGSANGTAAERPASAFAPLAAGLTLGKGLPASCESGQSEAGFLQWQAGSVRPHKDPSLAIVTVLLPIGDAPAPTLRALGHLVTRFGQDRARAGQNQDVVLPTVRREDLRGLWEGLASAGLAEGGVGTALDVTSCPGADTCGIGITSSKGLARAVRSELAVFAAANGVEPLRGATIRMSGCPNSCGWHHVASIGLHGVVQTIGGRQIPSYQLHLGGRVAPGVARFGVMSEKVPARRAPKVIRALFAEWLRDRRTGEPLEDFLARIPRERVRELIEQAGPVESDAAPASVSGNGHVNGNGNGHANGALANGSARVEAERLDVDWGQTETFSTIDIGTGECAGAGTDATVNPFDGVDAELEQVRVFLDAAQWADAAATLNRSHYTLARVLLERLGRTPDSDYEVACELRARVIDRGFADESWNALHDTLAALLTSREPAEAALRTARGQVAAVKDSWRELPARLAAHRAAQDDREMPG